MGEYSCKEIIFDGANNPIRCKCKEAALNAYEGMLDHGAAESEAVDAAYRLYKFHHPKDSNLDARLTVERWIYADRAH